MSTHSSECRYTNMELDGIIRVSVASKFFSTDFVICIQAEKYTLADTIRALLKCRSKCIGVDGDELLS